MRDASAGLEVLLLRRSRHSGFVPEMYVFPGGRVDASDADPAGPAWLDDLTPHEAAARLDLRDADPPAIAYFVAAFRHPPGIVRGRIATADRGGRPRRRSHSG